MKGFARGPHAESLRAALIVLLIGGSSIGCAEIPLEDVIRSLPLPLPLPNATRSRETAPRPVSGQRLVEVHWQHPAPATIERFKIYWGFEQGKYLAVEDIMPRPQRDGTFLAQLRVPANGTIHLAVSAVSAAGEGPRSNLGVCTPGCRRAEPMRTPKRH